MDSATHRRQKQMQDLKARHEKALRVREFLVSERDIVLGLLEKSLRGQDRERMDNLRMRIHEKDRQLHLVDEELKEIQTQLAEAKRRLRDTQGDAPKKGS